MNDTTLGLRVAGEIREKILTGEFAPGLRIRQEELAAQFGTSRVPVREALKQLESEGLVVIVPNSGVWIARVDIAECVEMWKIRERIEPLALGESLPHLTDEDILGLEEICAAIDSTTDVEEFLRLDRQFHLASYRSTAMPTLIPMIERIWNTTQHYRRAYTMLLGRERFWIIQCEHRLLMEAIKRRNVEDSERALYSHIRRTRMELERNRKAFSNITF
ncbi:GntR family transcriptional regulator [Shinella sp. CPCC 100929]|uniref:GntR family transcriptional regulator n=1 Tax=Shinella lacus TaxID=2654216 RepID=A0ABT1R1G0_9HYPH|nr:GntR family transcriptional regulator [Shinella lacus]MCQ4628994.1 GntR family transcriptional regulator [Shinella lacus]